MNGYFIYVYRPDDKDKLIAAGAKLISVDQRSQTIYVFENRPGLVDLLEEGNFIISNTLSFGCAP